MKEKIIEILKQNIHERFEKRVSFWENVELENFIEYSAEEIVKLYTIPTVINSRLSELEEENSKLKFIIENGLGAKDLQNDCL
jgi:hypothetical protein